MSIPIQANSIKSIADLSVAARSKFPCSHSDVFSFTYDVGNFTNCLLRTDNDFEAMLALADMLFTPPIVKITTVHDLNGCGGMDEGNGIPVSCLRSTINILETNSPNQNIIPDAVNCSDLGSKSFKYNRPFKLQSEADRLSELPESLILQILSLLEMKDAVKTGILSKRWENLWTQIDTVVHKFNDRNCDNEDDYNRKVVRFFSFVDRTLMKCVSPCIKRFSLSGSCTDGVRNDDKSVPQLASKWISFLMNKKVENLKLDLMSSESDYSVPDCLYSNSSFVELELSSARVLVSSPVSWSLLKKLSFSSMWVCDESMGNILLGCPVLETLVLWHVNGINELNIMSPSVKKLVLRQIEYDDVVDADFLDISAPWLEELVIMGTFLIPQCGLVNVASLKKATLASTYSCHPQSEFYDETAGNPLDIWWNDMVFELSNALCHVDEITLRAEVIQALAVAELRGGSYPIFKCKSLMFSSPILKDDIFSITCLLQHMPYLEALSITVSNWQRYYTIAQTMPFVSDYFHDRDLHLNLLEGKLMHLKSVKIEYIVEWEQKPLESFDFELLSYILRNASILEKIVLSTSGGEKCSGCPAYCACQNAPWLSAKLSATYMLTYKTLPSEFRKAEYVFELDPLSHAP